MKNQFILGLAFLALSLSACEDSIVIPEVTPTPVSVLSINSVYPELAESGSHITIFGENFGASISDNYVSFSGAFHGGVSEVLHVQPGIIVTRVPLNLVPGEYTISLSANGQSCTTKCLIVDLN